MTSLSRLPLTDLDKFICMDFTPTLANYGVSKRCSRIVPLVVNHDVLSLKLRSTNRWSSNHHSLDTGQPDSHPPPIPFAG